MADRTISELAGASLADNDKIYISKTSSGPLDKTITLADLRTFVGVGGTASGMHYTYMVLDNTAIKALPTTGSLTVVASPGVGKMHYIHSAILRVDCTAGVYTNIATDNSQLGLDLNDTVSTVSLMYNMSALNSPDGAAHTHIDDFLGSAAFPNLYLQQQPALPAPGGAGPIADVNYTDAPITLTCLNEFSGDYTGGDPANTLTIMCWYSTINLATGVAE